MDFDEARTELIELLKTTDRPNITRAVETVLARAEKLEVVAVAARGALDVNPMAGSKHAERHMQLEEALNRLDGE